MSWRNWLQNFRSSIRIARLGVVACLLPAFLAGCGFQPIAASSSSFGEQDIVLAQLEVSSSDPRFAYRLKKEMLRSVAIDPSASHAFSLNTRIERAGLAIEQNDTITRENVTARTAYALASREQRAGQDRASAVTGSTTVTTAVNKTSSQFSTTVSDREAVERLAKETAQRMLTFLRVNRANGVDGG